MNSTGPTRRSKRSCSKFWRISRLPFPNSDGEGRDPPIVVITSNRTREIHDALKRRCLYHWVGYPTAERELEIVRAKVPGIGKGLSASRWSHFVQALRKQDLFKSPGVAETLDWATALD